MITVAPGLPAGDVDGDGHEDAEDQLLFVNVMLDNNNNPTHLTRCDTTGVGLANGRDIQQFVDAIIGG